MLRCLSWIVIPLLVLASMLTLLCIWLCNGWEDDGGLLFLDREKQQYDQLFEQQENMEAFHRQVMQSQQRDVESRSKFQKDQVRKFCEAYYPKQLHILPESEPQRLQVHRHLLFDDSRRTIFCFVEKTGCTNMKRLMLISTGQLPLNTSHQQWVDLNRLEEGARRASFLNTSLTEEGRISRLNKYFKFTVIRNPLERLVATYRSKIEPPLLGLSLEFPDFIKRQVFELSRPIVYDYWLSEGASYNISITFSEFVEYYIQSFKDTLNPHMKPYTKICHPCNVPYDFYAHFTNYSQDVQVVVDKVGMNWNHFHHRGGSSAANTASITSDYYQTLSRMQRARLYDVLREELLFYYHLFPAERYSHRTLLGVGEHLYTSHGLAYH